MFADSHAARAYQELCLRDAVYGAGRDRLAWHLQAGQAKKDRIYCRALLCVGRWLVVWGQRLQDRYDTAPSISAPRSASHWANG